MALFKKNQEGTTTEFPDTESTLRTPLEDFALFKEIIAQLKEERANQGKPKPDQEPPNISRLVTLLQTLLKKKR